MRFVPITYITWVRTDVIFDIRILRNIGHGKNRLCQRKLEVATRSSYTWVKPMSELWRFVYIASHVTLHAKLDAQKVNCTIANEQKGFYNQVLLESSNLLHMYTSYSPEYSIS